MVEWLRSVSGGVVGRGGVIDDGRRRGGGDGGGWESS